MGNKNYEASLRASVTPTFEASRRDPPGDRYQAGRVVMEWLKKAGAPPKKAWETGKEEHRRWMVSYKEAYAMNPAAKG